MKSLIALWLCLIIQSNCTKTDIDVVRTDEVYAEDNIRGLNFVAPPETFTQNPMPAITAVNSDWIAVVPFAFTRTGTPTVSFGSSWQWWGERESGVRETIRLAKEAGIKVLMKPQVYIPGSWPGGLSFTNEEWALWEKDYTVYIMTFLEIAKDMKVEMFCIGTEFKQSSKNRSAYWEGLIEDVRTSYNGKLTYAANWDEYDQITFWDQLDYVGVDAYFPLVNEDEPSVESIKTAWNPISIKLQNHFDEWKKPILFTEFGYLSVDRCAYNTWELEANVRERPINEQAQANAYAGLFDALWETEYWAGGFLWKWYPNLQGQENYTERDYTPQGKISETVLADWYGR